MKLLNIVTLLTLKVVLGDHPTRLKTISTIFKFKLSKSIPPKYRNIDVPTVCALLKQNISHLIHQHFGRVSSTRLKLMARKRLMEVLPENLPGLEEPYHMFLLTRATKIPGGPRTDVSKLDPGFMLHMDFVFLNVEIIRGFASTLVAICSANS